MLTRARAIVCSIALAMPACARPSDGPPPAPSAGEPARAAKCEATGAVMELPTVALDPETRRQLAAQLEAGVVAVRFRAEGCQMELVLLPRCVGTPKYDYQPFWSAKADSELVHDADELSLKLPLGADCDGAGPNLAHRRGRG
jgi:hypothetical protein